MPQGLSGRSGFPFPRDIRVAAVFRDPEQFGGLSSVPQETRGGNLSVTQCAPRALLPCPRSYITELTAATRGGLGAESNIPPAATRAFGGSH